MKWLLGIVCILFLLNGHGTIAFWLVIGYLLYRWLRKPAEPNSVTNQTKQTWSYLDNGDLADLVLLKLELQRLPLDAERFDELNQRIDLLLHRYFADLDASPDSSLWQKRRAMAWELLNRHADTPLGLPPWQPITSSPSDTSEQTHRFVKPAVFSEPIEPEVISHIDNDATTPEPQPTISEPQPAQFSIDETEHTETLFQNTMASESKPINEPSAEHTFKQYAWQAQEPSRFERLVSTLSGWHSLAIPFLVQNIGWFIGVFCFIAGSMFLVSYSEGYVKNLIAFLSFFIFTLALLFGGYQLRHKRPELVTSSYVLFILSALLIPLTNLAATQLLLSSEGIGLRLVSALLVLVELGVFYFAVTLIAGMLDRSLQHRLPQFFLALTASQLLQLLLLVWPVWPVLAMIHLAIFALLTVAIYLFASQWLQAIFVEQKSTAYFAAGTLLYSALIAFVFNTVANTIELPNGYYGVFLMLLCGLLFFVDGQLKQWLEQHAYLSRFSFFVYGLSVLALYIAAPYQIASILTLILAMLLYGFIVWRYLTLTPLSIFLVTVFWLYSIVLLQYLPENWHFLASLPLLLALYRLANWAFKQRQSDNLAVIVYRVLYGLLVALTVWSLFHSEPSMVAMLTAISAAGLFYYSLQVPQYVFTNQSLMAKQPPVQPSSTLNSAWFYLIPVLAAVTVFYTPRLFAWSDAAQLSFGLLLLAAFWCYFGVQRFFAARATSAPVPIEQLLNSGLVSWLAALLPLVALSNPQRIGVLLLAGAIALWLGYQLLARWLFYAVLLLWAAAFALIKITFFPPPSSGLASLLLGIGLWFWLWFVERTQYSELNQLRREQIEQQLALLPDCQLLLAYRLPRDAMLFRELTLTPLEQSMVALWLLGLSAIIGRVIEQQFSYSLLASMLCAAVLSKLLVIRYAQIVGFVLPVMLSLAALLFWLHHLGVGVEVCLLATVLFGLVVWQLTLYSLNRPVITQLLDALNPEVLQAQARIEQVIHHTAFSLVLLASVLQIMGSGLIQAQGLHSEILVATLLTATSFFWLSDQRSAQQTVRYGVLVYGLLLVVEIISLVLHPFSLQTLAMDSYAGLLLALLSVLMAGLTLLKNNYRLAAVNMVWLLAGCAVLLQIHFMLQRAAMIVPLDYIVLLIAVLSSVLANRLLAWQWYSTTQLWIAVLAVLWLAHSVLHPNEAFNLWLGSQFIDSWWLLAIISLALAQLGQRFQHASFYSVANGGFVWTLLGALTLFFMQPIASFALLALLLVLIGVAWSVSKQPALRDLLAVSLVTLVVLGLLTRYLDDVTLQTAIVLWALLLWFRGLHASGSVFSPWLGWWLLFASPVCWQQLSNHSLGVYCLEVFVYSLLLLRFSAWQGFIWLSAFAFIAAGVAFNLDNAQWPMNLLWWSNGQLLLANLWQRKGEAVARRWHWQQTDFAPVFIYSVQAVFIVYLLLATGLILTTLLDAHDALMDALPVGVLLAASLLHLLWIRFSTLALHSLIYTVLLVLWTGYRCYFHELLQPPLFLALWSVLLWLGGMAVRTRRFNITASVSHAIGQWLQVSVLLATTTLLMYRSNSLGELLICLAIVAGLSVALANKQLQSAWLIAARLEFLVLLHAWPLWLVGTAMPSLLLPWYALQSIVLAIAASYALKWFLAKHPNNDYQEYYQQALSGTVWLIALGVIEWLAHAVLISSALLSHQTILWLSAFDQFAAVISIILVIGHASYQIRRLPDSSWIYGIVLLTCALGGYIRLVWLGNMPMSFWDTAVIIVFAYSLFFIQHLFPSKPLFNSAMIMPVLALFTVPLQLATPETSLVFILSGGLYVLMRRASQQKIPLYLALLAFNAGIYLWVPSLAQQSQLLQWYIMPAALSVLLLLQLHSRELKPSVLMGSRLMATSSIYACATADVFLRAELSIFVLAIILSLAGVVLGIALRIRAFLYAGISFLLLNVIGQLIHFYPEQRLGKAIVLMVIGAMITGIMIWFNMQKVIIMQRINAIRAELQEWQ